MTRARSLLLSLPLAAFLVLPGGLLAQEEHAGQEAESEEHEAAEGGHGV